MTLASDLATWSGGGYSAIPDRPTYVSPALGSSGAATQFWSTVLQDLGAPVTANNISVLSAWSSREGTSAAWNPLASTQGMGTNFNRIGVKNYPDANTGAKYTAQTIENGYYPSVLAALRADVPLSTWTGGATTYDATAKANGTTTSTLGTGGILGGIEQLPGIGLPITGGAALIGGLGNIGKTASDIAGIPAAITSSMGTFLAVIMKGSEIVFGLIAMGVGLWIVFKSTEAGKVTTNVVEKGVKTAAKAAIVA